MTEAIEELKLEEAKYRRLYNNGSVLDGLKADAFKLAIDKFDTHSVQDTYIYFKEKSNEFINCPDKLGRNLANAYGLVVGKLWKYTRTK